MRQVLSVGIDVSARELVVAVRRLKGTPELLTFSNDTDGHRKLIRRVTKGGQNARVALESTGVYGMDLALALDEAPRIEVMVANPRAVKDFGDALLKRTKTDPEDALVILEFVERMPFLPWTRPSDNSLILRTIARRIVALTQDATAEKNRLHAAAYLSSSSPVIRRDIQVNLRHLQRRLTSLKDHALSVIQGDAELASRFQLLISVPGVAQVSAVRILGELVGLAPDMTARQWVAHAGLDPRHHDSGTSVNKPTRISNVGNQRRVHDARQPLQA